MMKMDVSLTFLGTGTSRGIPMLGCTCEACTSKDTRDNRTRSAAVVRCGNTTFLIDCGPDIRFQLLRENICNVDAVLLTHFHGDHLHGIDDLQMLTYISKKELPFWASARALQEVQTNFPYLFMDKCKFKTLPNGEMQRNWHVPQLDFHTWNDDFAAETIEGVSVQPVPLWHGSLMAIGYRIGNLAYLTDCSDIPEESFDFLHDLDVLVIDGLRPDKPHPTHFCFQQAIEVIQRICPRVAYLTHLCHDVLHERNQKLLPANVFLPFDGLTVHSR